MRKAFHAIDTLPAATVAITLRFEASKICNCPQFVKPHREGFCESVGIKKLLFEQSPGTLDHFPEHKSLWNLPPYADMNRGDYFFWDRIDYVC